MNCFSFPSVRLPATGAASGFTVQERPPEKPFPMFFPGELLLPGKEEFAGNALQNGGNRRGCLPSHRRKPLAVTARMAKAWDNQTGIKG